VKQGARFAAVGLTYALVGISATWGEPVFTADKQRLCTKCSTYEWPIERPSHGIVFVSGSLLGPEVNWIFLNVDSHQLSRVLAVRREGTSGWVVRKVEHRSIDSDGVEPIVAIANSLWSSGILRAQRPPATDGWQDLYLIDEDNIRHEQFVELKDLPSQLKGAMIGAWYKHK